MAQNLWAIGNATGTSATWRSTEYAGDQTSLPADAVAHTGGGDGNFVKIADCSDSNYFPGHHCTIAADDGTWTISVWNDDHQDHLLYWSAGTYFSNQNPIAGTNNWRDVTLLVKLGAKGPVLTCNTW